MKFKHTNQLKNKTLNKMARKRKQTSKDLNEDGTMAITTTTPVLTTMTTFPQKHCLVQPASAENRENLNELMLQQETTAEELGILRSQQYESDGELIELQQKLNLVKNKSNLFLIKSYSFNDKTAIKRPLNLNVKTKLHTGILNQATTSDKDSKLNKLNANKNKQKQSEKDDILEKPKKPPKLKKIKKSKSSCDATKNIPDYQQFLRKSSLILADKLVKVNTSDSSLTAPVIQTNYGAVIKSKTLDDIESPPLKRDSFIRHSLQSIRKSFSLSKKLQQNNISFNTNSSVSSSSNSSAASDTLRKIKSKECIKDIGNLKDVEETNYLIAEEEQEGQESDCHDHITFNDAAQLPQCQQQNSRGGNSCSFKATPIPLYTMDAFALAALKEEDEKYFNSCVNIVSSDNNNEPTCVIAQQRSTSSVSTLAQLPTSPMAPLQTHTECQSVQCLNILDKDYTEQIAGLPISSPRQKAKKAFQHQLSTPESLQSTSIGCATSSEYSSARSLKHSASSLTPLQTLNSSGSFRSISPSRGSASSNSSSTAKHEQSTAAATAAAAATATTSTGSLSTTTTPPEKEKKRKEISSSRVKKFHRHFSQVSKDEKLINYFSCALVSDILLQGHLYITDQHFAFYSNVFGYVTKVVIPTSSVTRISKEKTAKIIPNAVGVATADERHVFGSFISREAAFRLMCSVCPPLGAPEILPKDPANIEICEEYSIEDDSSCSISGNESPAQITEIQNPNANGKLLHTDTSQTLLRRSVGSSNLSIAETTANKIRHSDIPTSAKTTTNAASIRSSAPAATTAHLANGGVKGLNTLLQPATSSASEGEAKLNLIIGCASTTTSTTSTPTPSTTSSPTTIMTMPTSKVNCVMNIFSNFSKKFMVHVKFPTEIHVVYIGVILTLLLAIFSIFLLYRILDIEAKANSYRSPLEFNWRSGNDDDIFAEALRFQKQLQLKSTEEAQQILKTNLEQIAKVRRSLETLSMLIHDRISSFASTNADDSD